jgi:hypothetical protein
MDIIHKSGSWFTYKTYKWHGLAEVKNLFETDEDFRNEITALVNNQDDDSYEYDPDEIFS